MILPLGTSFLGAFFPIFLEELKSKEQIPSSGGKDFPMLCFFTFQLSPGTFQSSPQYSPAVLAHTFQNDYCTKQARMHEDAPVQHFQLWTDRVIREDGTANLKTAGRAWLLNVQLPCSHNLP